MLQLQLKSLAVPKLPKKVIFFIQLSFFCILLHFGLLVLFFVAQDFKKNLFIDTLNPDVAIVFVPLLKTPHLVQQQTSVSLPPKVVHNKPTTGPATRMVPVQKKVVQKPVQKKAQVVKKQEPKKITQKKIVPKVEEKKVIEQKQPEKKQPEPVKQEVIKQDNVAQNTLLVGNEERDIFILQEQLKKNILQHWKRPSNIPDNSICQLKVILHKDGSREIIVEKSSHAMALDISARNFLLQYDFPEQLYGKELSIIF